MKRFLSAILLAALIGIFAGAQGAVSAEEAASYAAADWHPHNYVMTEGFGLNAKKVSVRTDLSYADGALKVSGSTSKGGVGVTFGPEIDLANFSMELSLDNWNVNSTDKWFGLTFMDKGERSDIYNEVPFWSKHSESWSNDYGAGTLFAWRPFSSEGAAARPGVLHVQFNNIGIKHSFTDPQTGEYDPEAGKYADGVLGWSGYLSTIQLCNTDWTPMTDYSSVKISSREIEEDGHKGYAFEINDGYWYRTDDSISWPTQEGDPELYAQLDLNENGELDDWEKKLFQYGPAYQDTEHGETYQSWVPYVNWGDPLYSLYNFNQLVKQNGGRLYLSAMYKDAFNMSEGQAQFTVKEVNGRAATASETLDLNAAKSVSANGIKATVAAENLYAGVYPSMLKGMATAEGNAKTVQSVQDRIDAKRSELGAGKAEPVSFFGQVSLGGADKNVSIISKLEIEYDIAGKDGFEVYKVTGTDLDKVNVTVEGTSARFEIKDSDSVYVLFYSGGTEAGGGSSAGVIIGVIAAVVVVAAAVVAIVLVRKKKQQ